MQYTTQRLPISSTNQLHSFVVHNVVNVNISSAIVTLWWRRSWSCLHRFQIEFLPFFSSKFFLPFFPYGYDDVAIKVNPERFLSSSSSSSSQLHSSSSFISYVVSTYVTSNIKFLNRFISNTPLRPNSIHKPSSMSRRLTGLHTINASIHSRRVYVFIDVDLQSHAVECKSLCCCCCSCYFTRTWYICDYAEY